MITASRAAKFSLGMHQCDRSLVGTVRITPPLLDRFLAYRRDLLEAQQRSHATLMATAVRGNPQRPSFPADAIAARDAADAQAQKEALTRHGFDPVEANAIDHTLRSFGTYFSAKKMADSAAAAGISMQGWDPAGHEAAALRSKLGDSAFALVRALEDDVAPLYEAENDMCKQFDGWA